MGWLNHMAYFYLSILSLIATKSWCRITNVMNENESRNGTRWAVLVAGSNDYSNYRHQVINLILNQLTKSFLLKIKIHNYYCYSCSPFIYLFDYSYLIVFFIIWR